MLDPDWFGEGSYASKNTVLQLIRWGRVHTVKKEQYQTGVIDGDWFEKESRQQALQ